MCMYVGICAGMFMYGPRKSVFRSHIYDKAHVRPQNERVETAAKACLKHH